MTTTQVVIKYNIELDEIESIKELQFGKYNVVYSSLADVPYENVEAKYIMLRMIPDGGSIKGVGVRGRPYTTQRFGSDGMRIERSDIYVTYAVEV